MTNLELNKREKILKVLISHVEPVNGYLAVGIHELADQIEAIYSEPGTNSQIERGDEK